MQSEVRPELAQGCSRSSHIFLRYLELSFFKKRLDEATKHETRQAFPAFQISSADQWDRGRESPQRPWLSVHTPWEYLLCYAVTPRE